MSDKTREALAGLLVIVDGSSDVAGCHPSGNIAGVEEGGAALARQGAQASALDEFELEEMARIAFEEAMAFGVSVDSFMRLARWVSSVAHSRQAASAVEPENKNPLKTVERQPHQPILSGHFQMETSMTASEHWTIHKLNQALQSHEQVQTGELVITLLQGAEPSIQVELTDFGGLKVFIAVVGEQIIVDTVLVDQASITDVVTFNDAVLRSRDLFPLSSIGIATMPNGQTVYNIFGSLSSASSLTNVVTEIFTLAENTQRAIDAFSSFIKTAE